MINPSSVNPSILPSLPLANRRSLPNVPCIYFAIDSQGTIQYIGRSVNLRQCWVQHHRYPDLEILGKVNVAWLEVSNIDLLPAVEEALIEWFDPPLNGFVRRRLDSGLGQKPADKPTRIKWRLAAVMADRELDYKELAQLAGLHPVTVNKHKNLKVMPSRIEDGTLEKYCRALRCQPGDLLVYVEAKVND